MSEVRPSGGELDGAAQLLAAARARLSSALADLALPEAHRLSDWHRRTLSSLLANLVGSIEDDLRAALAIRFEGEVAAALSSAHVPIVLPILEPHGPLADHALLAALLRRAEEHRLSRIRPDTALLVELAGEEDEEVAAEAMSLLVAHSSRLDSFQEPLIARVELPAELQHGLVWTVAAALRRYLIDRHAIPAPAADEAVAASASELLIGYDEGRSVQALALRLARRLSDTGRLDDQLIVRILSEGGLPLFLASISARTGLDCDAVWEILTGPAGRGAVLLLRAAGIARRESAAILLQLAGGGEEAIVPQLDLYDALSDEEARRLVALWRLDPAYRTAIARLAA